MKKTLLILSVIVFISLASCDDFNPYASFSPPSWIIGTWSDEFDSNTYTFSVDNILLESSMVSMSIDFKEAFKEATVEEVKTDSLYKVTVTAEGVTGIYRFEKKTDTSLDYYVTSNGVTVGPLELLRD